MPSELDTLLDPQVIIEILSPATADYDRGEKYRQYQQLDSVLEYVLVAQDEPILEQRVRQSDGSWVETNVEGLDQEFAFATVPVRVRLSDVYAGVTFPEPGGR
jgi:Uma2 family endonuclease